MKLLVNGWYSLKTLFDDESNLLKLKISALEDEIDELKSKITELQHQLIDVLSK